MHGGADGIGAPKGAKNGNYKHGRYTAEVGATRRWLSDSLNVRRWPSRAGGTIGPGRSLVI
jgi:hypothetical protein